MASAIGLAGFLAGAGAGILYVRFTAAGLPADQAMAAVPQHALVEFGAVSLTLYLILAAFAVVIVFLVDFWGFYQPRIIGLLLVVALELQYLIWTAPLGGGWRILTAAFFLIPPALAGLIEWRAAKARPLSGITATLLPGGSRTSTGPDSEQTKRQKIVSGLLYSLLVALMLVVIVALCLAALTLGLSVLVAVLLAAVLLRIYSVNTVKNQGFVIPGIAVFISVALFGAAATVIKTWKNSAGEPAAVLLKANAGAICGLYIAETGTRVYLARSYGKSGDLFWVPKDEVAAVRIGRLESVTDADMALPLLYKELISNRVPGADAITTVRVTTTGTETDTTTVVGAEPETAEPSRVKARLAFPSPERTPSSCLAPPRERQARHRRTA